MTRKQRDAIKAKHDANRANRDRNRKRGFTDHSVKKKNGKA